jgi:hypothetical protein
MNPGFNVKFCTQMKMVMPWRRAPTGCAGGGTPNCAPREVCNNPCHYGGLRGGAGVICG